MKTQLSQPSIASPTRQTRRAFPVIDPALERSVNLVAQSIGAFESDGERYEIPRLIFVGPRGGGETIRLGIFAGIHGDEPEGVHALIRFLSLLEQNPEIARGYCLFIYPVCNPTGFQDRTRASRSGKDLNREFWKRSAEPEVQLLEAELRNEHFHGMVTLHSDDTSDGVYGFVRGATLTKNLLLPALEAAGSVLPRNEQERIDGFAANQGIITDCYPGVLSAAPGMRPKPFEIILETPQSAPQLQQQQAFILALNSILVEYRKLMAYAANL